MKTERQRMDIIYMNEQIILLNDSMPAGFFRCCAGEDRRLDIVNHELLSLFGCTDTKELEELTGGTLKGMLDVRIMPGFWMRCWSSCIRVRKL